MLKWTPYWTSAFIEGPHVDARRDGLWVARVVACRRLQTMPIMPHPSGRERRLYLAMVNRGRGWEVAGVYATASKAKRECARALGEVPV
jgi:hypothetical protein